ncbi:MAG: arylsulfatase, partial [Pseudomonadota bacterium]
DADAEPRKTEQFFDNNGSRGLYLEGWFAGTFGPFTPWDSAGSATGIADWDSDDDEWELYYLAEDFSQADDLADERPEKLEELKARFLEVAEDNRVFPIGAGNWLRIHPADRIAPPYDSWNFGPQTRRMPEFAAPGIGRQSTRVVIDAEFGEAANGVLYAVGGAGGGLTVYVEDGVLTYEYNMFIIETTQVRTEPLPAGRHEIVVATTVASPGGPAEVVITVNGSTAAMAEVPRTVPVAFSATESFDVGRDLGSPVSLAYEEARPFAFDGTIHTVQVAQGSALEEL